MNKNNTNASKKKQGRLDWIETVEVERVEEDSTIGGGGSTTPILTKQRTTSSNDHTSDGESSTDDVAVHGTPAVVSSSESNSPPSARTTRQKNTKKNQQIPIITTLPTTNSNSDHESQSGVERNVIDSDNTDDASIEGQTNRRRSAVVCCILILVVVAAIVGGVCGSGKCPAGRRKKASQAATTLYPFLYNDVCERAVGPVLIGTVPSIGLLESVQVTSVIPICPASDSTSVTSDGSTTGTVSRLGRWFKVTGGDEVIRISTCDRSPIYKTTADTVVTIYEGDDCGNITCVSANDDFCGTSSSVSLLAKKGKNYYIFVTRNKDGSATSNANSSATDSNSFDFVLSVDHENNGICENAIGPLSPSPLPQSKNENSTSVVIPGSLRASDALPYVMSCDSRIALDGNVWYTVQGTGSWLKASTCHDITDFPARIDVTYGDCTDQKCVSVRDSDCNGLGYQSVWRSRSDTIYNLGVFKGNLTSGKVFGLSVESFEPVSNDQCDTPSSVAGDGTLIVGSTLDATIDFNVPKCLSNDAKQTQPGVWYLVPGSGKTMIASTCNNETNFSTEISIFLAGDSCEASLACVTSSRRQFCRDFKSAVYWESEVNQQYLIYVTGSDYGSLPNIGQFGLTVTDFVAESNDLCIDAIAMDLTNNSIAEGSTSLATADVACTSSTAETPGVWYSILGTGGSVLASTCNPRTTFDTQVSVFTGSCPDSLVCVASDDNSCGMQGSAAWVTELDTKYYILVHGGQLSSAGDFVLSVKKYNPTQKNDFCSKAISIETNGTVLFGSTVQATFDNIGSCQSVANTGAGVWYEMVGTGRRVTASLCHNDTTFKTAISILEGNCTSLTCVAANDESVVNGCSEVTWLSAFDKTYRILVHGYEEEEGNFGVSLIESKGAVANDFCVDATPVTLSSKLITGSTKNSTIDDVATCMDIVQTGYGVWYSVIGTGDRIFASTCNKTSPDFDTKISVFTGPNCGSLTCVVADDNGCGVQSRAIWRTEPNVMYYILVHSDEGGEFSLSVDIFVPMMQNDFCPSRVGPILPNGQVAVGSTYGTSLDNMGYCGADNTGPGSWFFVMGTGERLTVDTCDNRTNFDTKISIFSGFDCFNLTCVTGNDDACGLQSSVTWQTTLGKFYYILLHGWGTSSFGNYALTVSGSEIFPF